MIDLVSEEKTSEIVVKFINDLSSKYSFYEMSIMLDVNEKTIYKWRNGSIPKADKFINLHKLHMSLN